MVESLQKKFRGTEGAEDSESDASDDADLFSMPLNSEAFMAKIAQQKQSMFK